ncbi:MAG: CbiX/SirB N-terminal domain-containing protein [Candidatus Omnitrophica bacterium]|nr:CbiX/SirB N-terminal domain-containing protein [Candidatus Omnitrophota bacterium]
MTERVSGAMSAPHPPIVESQPRSAAVVLIGHGAPAIDCPPHLVGELMALEWRKDRSPHGHDRLEGRAAELDAAIRNWPRHDANDPYKAGLEQLASTLRPLLPTTIFAIGYNEFCRPSIPEAVEQVIQQGARRVVVIPTMMTPGGIHSERDIPHTLEEVRRAHPGIAIEYLWPFSLTEVAALLASHIQRALHGARP